MSLSILYCGECEKILAASPDLTLTAECLAHTAGGVVHRGYLALRLSSADPSSSDLADLDALAAKYPKSDYVTQLELLAGSCP